MNNFKYRYYNEENEEMVYVNESEGRMPSTGVVDVDNNEAYVGDVVRYGVGFSKKGKIIFENSSFLIEPEDAYALVDRIDTAFKIIGNIVENPELFQKEE
jgi:hypothetical protein